MVYKKLEKHVNTTTFALLRTLEQTLFSRLAIRQLCLVAFFGCHGDIWESLIESSRLV